MQQGGYRKTQTHRERKNNIFNKDVFEITIIEDSVTELGVISALSASGEDTLKTLFTPIDEYLEWYLKSEKKSNYLYYGSDREPAEFDFVSLSKLAALLADRDHELRFGRLHERITNRNCDFCGRRVRKMKDWTGFRTAGKFVINARNKL